MLHVVFFLGPITTYSQQLNPCKLLRSAALTRVSVCFYLDLITNCSFYLWADCSLLLLWNTDSCSPWICLQIGSCAWIMSEDHRGGKWRRNFCFLEADTWVHNEQCGCGQMSREPLFVYCGVFAADDRVIYMHSEFNFLPSDRHRCFYSNVLEVVCWLIRRCIFIGVLSPVSHCWSVLSLSCISAASAAAAYFPCKVEGSNR